jgi:hypothetical protein
VEYSHQYSPRKWRTFNSYAAQPSIFRKHPVYTPGQNAPERKWIGKYLIPYQSKPPQIEKGKEYITEYEIMRMNGMYSYRLIFVEPTSDPKKFVILSKLSIESRPHQLNIYLTRDQKIVEVKYF